MKKFLFPITMILVAALLLAACATPANTDVTPGAETLEVPATGAETPADGVDPMPTVEATETIEMATPVDAGDIATPTVDSAADVIATLGPTAEETGSPASAVTVTPEPGGAVDTITTTPVTGDTADEATPGAGTTATPAAGTGAAGTPSAGMEGERFVRLSDLINAQVSSSDNQAAGETDGILVEHPELPGSAGEGAADATPTVAADEAGAHEFTVRYVLLDVSQANLNEGAGATPGARSGRIVILPWQALNLDEQQSTGSITLEFDRAALANAPRHTLTDVASGSNWAEDVTSYWSSEGVAGIPATGAANENLALIPRNFQGITVQGLEGNDFGGVADFVIDASTGEVVHLVINGGEVFGNRTFAVPLSHLTWLGGQGTQLGSFQFNFPSDSLETAPELNLDVQQFQLDRQWQEQLNQFWESVQR